MKWLDHRQMVKVTGASYRQIDHWTTTGRIYSPETGQGNTSTRFWSETEAEVAGLIFRLTKSAGMNLDVAAYLARHAVEDNVETLTLGHGMTIHVPRPARGYAAHREGAPSGGTSG